MKPTKEFLCSYHHDGAEWSVNIHAYDWKDAEERCKKLGWLRLDGEVVAKVPARLGLLAKFGCWIGNVFRMLRSGLVTDSSR